jgi:hypothetical protein
MLLGKKAFESSKPGIDLFRTNVATVKGQLQAQYNAVTDVSKYKYKYNKHLDTLFEDQAQKLVRAGVTNIYDVGVETRPPTEKGGKSSSVLINKSTGEALTLDGKELTANKKVGGMNTWGKKNVKPGFAHYGIQVTDEGQVLFLPVWRDTSDIGLLTPVLTVAGAFFGGPTGAAIGNSVGQLGATGKIDPLQVALAYGTAYVGADIASGLGSGAGSITDAAFVAADASQLAAQGLGEAAITQNLLATGVNQATAQTAATLALSGATEAAIANQLGSGSLFDNIPKEVLDLPKIDLLGDVTFPEEGLQVPAIDSAQVSLLPEGTVLPGEGLLAPTLPSIGAMGGAQGLSVGVPGGTITQAGLTPTGSVPVLGDSSSFINDPNVLGQPVIAVEPLPTTPIGIEDLIKGVGAVDQLLNPPDAGGRTQVPMDTGGGMRAQGVDYSGLLSLLQARASAPNIVGLLGPAQIRYSSLLG